MRAYGWQIHWLKIYGTEAVFELYDKSDDPEVKTMLIDALSRISKIKILAKIPLFDPSAEYRRRVLERIKMRPQSEHH